jgi:hypothetical protein
MADRVKERDETVSRASKRPSSTRKEKTNLCMRSIFKIERERDERLKYS